MGRPIVLTNDDSDYLKETALLDYGHASVTKLIQDRGWQSLPIGQRIGATYAFVRDEIRFGYNPSDRICASQVLVDGHGQCNTKTILLMALLRGVGVKCRLHGATIHKRLQKGVVTGLWYWLAPSDIVHSWAEVLVDGRWVALEGVILDRRYLDGLRAFLPDGHGAFLGYGVGTDNLASPPVEWHGDETAIQMTGVKTRCARNRGWFSQPTSDAYDSSYFLGIFGQ
jgi:transglutaminase-like putative cysteine protease